MSSTGANANSTHTSYGISSTISNTGTSENDLAGSFVANGSGTTSVNTAGYFSASGATTNYAIIAAAGNVGIGTTTPTEALTLAANSNFGTYLGTPGTPTATGSNTGGSLATATYFYKITALDSQGNQTAASAESNPGGTVSSGSVGSVTVSWTAVPGASSYRVYQGTSSNGENVYYTTTLTTFIATGTGTTAAAPPTTNSAFVNKFLANGNAWLQGTLNIGLSATTPAPLSVSGGVGGNAAAIVNQTNSGDIFTASSSGTTRFTISNVGNVTFNSTTPVITFSGTGTLAFNNGTTNILQLVDTSSSQTDLKLGVANARNGILTLFSSGQS